MLCFFLFFLWFPEFIVVIRYFVWGSPFSCGSRQDWRDHRPTHHPAHAGFRPRTTMNHFYMNDDAIGRFSLSAPFWGLLLFCLFFDFLHAISCRSPHFCWLLCFDKWADFLGLFLLFCCSNNFHFMFSFLRHSSGFFAPFWFCAR